ncbi:hypothetical protein YN1HA_5010 [Sulfurisphaera ohwakuensis]
MNSPNTKEENIIPNNEGDIKKLESIIGLIIFILNMSYKLKNRAVIDNTKKYMVIALFLLTILFMKVV